MYSHSLVQGTLVVDHSSSHYSISTQHPSHKPLGGPSEHTSGTSLRSMETTIIPFPSVDFEQAGIFVSGDYDERMDIRPNFQLPRTSRRRVRDRMRELLSHRTDYKVSYVCSALKT